MMSNAPRTVITSYEEFPYGAAGESYTGSSNGFPPNPNPVIGELFVPNTADEYKAYPALANKLTAAINAAIPEGSGPIVDIELRTASNDTLNALYGLSLAAFKLGEVDVEHPLLKIATLRDFESFHAAVWVL